MPAQSLETRGNRPLAIVTGGIRGIGEKIVRNLARDGFDIATPHRDPDKQTRRAEPLIKAVEAMGGKMIAPAVDLTDYDAASQFIAQVGDVFNKPVKLLVHNHAGGAEDWADEEYIYRVNADSKVNLTIFTSGLNQSMANGEPNPLIILDEPSLWSWEYPIIDQLPDYEPIARTKAAGMRGLEDVVDRLNQDPRNDLVLQYVVGHGIGDTLIMRRYRQLYPELIAKIEATAIGGKFPVMQDMADAVARLATGKYPDRHAEFVGIPHWDKERIKKEFGNIYGPEAIRIDDIVFFGNEGFATYTPRPDYQPSFQIEESDVTIENNIGNASLSITPEQTKGHLKPVAVFRGVDQYEAARQAAVALLQQQGYNADVPLQSASAEFKQPVVHENITIILDNLIFDPYIVISDLLKQDGGPASSVDLIFENYSKQKANYEHLKTDMVEWVAQALGAVCLKNRYYPEVSDKAQESGKSQERALPLFDSFEQASYEADEVDLNKPFTSHVRIDEEDKHGFSGSGTVYQDGKKIMTVKQLKAQILPEKVVMRIIERSKPKHPDVSTSHTPGLF